MKYNIDIKSLLCGSLLLLAGGASLTSCTDWLEKEKEAVVAEDEAFKNFENFQGYIEEIYQKIPDKEKVNYCTSWNFGDDAVHNPEGYAHMDHQVDLGNYRNWISNNQCWLNGQNGSLWRSAWYCIRKCNQGMENINSAICTDEEKDLLLGQMYFFRAWWHFELMCYFGGMPYIDKSFEDGKIPELPRLSFQECADRCAADLQKAYELLPLNWDNTVAGKKSAGKNDLRINKYMALCYLGKVYLWAGSPLMKEFEKSKNGGVVQLFGASSNGKTYDYDVKYCKLAAEALGKALQMAENPESSNLQYHLADFKYSDIYDHEKDENSETNYSDNFYTVKQSWKQPGTTEAIFRGVSFTEQGNANGSNWNFTKIFGPKVAGLVDHDNIIHQPTANLVDQYGMSNGQPIYIVRNGKYVLNPDSGWDPTHPFKDRDPRFYHDIIFDGFHYVKNREALTEAQKELEYCSLYTGGAMRAVDNGSSTGYFIQKLVPHQCNHGDRWYDWDYALHTYLPYMRLADVYLMYAEARTAIAENTNDYKKDRTYCPSLSAVDAINRLRSRVNSIAYPMAGVQPQFMDTREHFLDEIRRERAVELAFEGFRWCDLQRWLLLTEPPYTTKYSHEFDRAQLDKTGEIDFEWYKKNDPKEAKVANFHSEEIISRDFTSKHYWFPLPDKDVYLYEGFPQNPGW